MYFFHWCLCLREGWPVFTDDLYLLLFSEVQVCVKEVIAQKIASLYVLGALLHMGLREGRYEKVFHSSLRPRKQLINVSANELSTDGNVRPKIRLSTYDIFTHYQDQWKNRSESCFFRIFHGSVSRYLHMTEGARLSCKLNLGLINLLSNLY